MKNYEYEIIKYPSDQFSQLTYFCTAQGECELNELPLDQMQTMKGVLNEMGAQGWELVQLFFGKDGIVALWKKEV